MVQNPWFYMIIAIGFELLGTNCAKLSSGLTEVAPTILMYVTYGCCVSALAIALDTAGVTTATEERTSKIIGTGEQHSSSIIYTSVVSSSTTVGNGLDLGGAYAAWSGIGTVVATLLGVFAYGEK
jgi:multidrug transporter EmrE-like cation transporter